MILSKRITAKSREAKPEIQASKRTVKVMRELRPAAFVSVEDFICLVVAFLSGNMIFAFVVPDVDDDDDLFDNMFVALRLHGDVEYISRVFTLLMLTIWCSPYVCKHPRSAVHNTLQIKQRATNYQIAICLS